MKVSKWRTEMGADPIYANKGTPNAGAPAEPSEKATESPFFIVGGQDLSGVKLQPGHPFIVDGQDLAAANDTLEENAVAKKRRFARLYNGVSMVGRGLKHSFTTKAGLKDLAAGTAIGSGLKITAIGLGYFGIMSVSAPVIFGLGVAGSVAKTVWQINKERLAAEEAANPGFPAPKLRRNPFKAMGQNIKWLGAKENRTHAKILLGGTFLSIVGAAGAITAIGAVWDNFFGPAPVVPTGVTTDVVAGNNVAAPAAPVHASAAPVHAPAAPVAVEPKVAAPVHAPVTSAETIIEHKPTVLEPAVKPAAPVAAPIEAPKAVEITPQAEAPVAAPYIEPDLSIITLDDTVTAPLELDIPPLDVTDLAPKAEDITPPSAADVQISPNAPLAAPITAAPLADAPKITSPVHAAPVPVTDASQIPATESGSLAQPLAPELASAPNAGGAFNLIVSPQPDGTFIGRVKGLAEGVTRFKATISELALSPK